MGVHSEALHVEVFMNLYISREIQMVGIAKKQFLIFQTCPKFYIILISVRDFIFAWSTGPASLHPSLISSLVSRAPKKPIES